MGKKALIVLTAIIFTLLIPTTQALSPVPGWETSCTNSTHIFKETQVNHNNTIYNFNNSIKCSYGCDVGRDVCNIYPGGFAMPGEYFLLLSIFALLIFGYMIFRLGVKPKEMNPADLIFSVICFMAFSVLALQGNSVVDMATGEAIQITLAVWLFTGFAGLSIAIFIFNIFKFIQREVTTDAE